MDPISISAAFAAVKGGISAGKSLMNMTKELSSFFDASDAAQADHVKKKNSVFSSANEEALTTFMNKTLAKEAEEELRNYLVNSRGLSAYNELQSIRREIRIERKEAIPTTTSTPITFSLIRAVNKRFISLNDKPETVKGPWEGKTI